MPEFIRGRSAPDSRGARKTERTRLIAQGVAEAQSYPTPSYAALLSLRSDGQGPGSQMVKLLGIVLLWSGIIAGAISLFASLLTPLDMADWAWTIVQCWQD